MQRSQSEDVGSSADVPSVITVPLSPSVLRARGGRAAPRVLALAAARHVRALAIRVLGRDRRHPVLR